MNGIGIVKNKGTRWYKGNEIVPFDDPEDFPSWLNRVLESGKYPELDPYKMRVDDFMQLRRLWKTPQMSGFEKSLVGLAEGTQHFKDDMKWLIGRALGELINYGKRSMGGREFSPREERRQLIELSDEE